MTQQPDLDVGISVREWWPSSNIEGIGYDASSRTLEVRFKSETTPSRYRYGNVSLAQAAPLLTDHPDKTLLRGLTPGQYLSTRFVMRPDTHPFVKMAVIDWPCRTCGKLATPIDVYCEQHTAIDLSEPEPEATP